MVVDDSVVRTGLVFSSALAMDVRLTTPRAARATVHLLKFIRLSDRYCVAEKMLSPRGQKQSVLALIEVRHGIFIGKVGFNDNIFPKVFSRFCARMSCYGA